MIMGYDKSLICNDVINMKVPLFVVSIGFEIDGFVDASEVSGSPVGNMKFEVHLVC